jgi:hypothetical protein
VTRDPGVAWLRGARAFWLGLGILSVSGLLLMGDIFLLIFEIGSRGESDIAARGPFLLALFVTDFAIATAAVVAVIAAVRARRSQQFALRDALVAVCLVSLAYVALYLDPNVIALRTLSALRGPLGRWAGYYGFVAADLVVVACAVVLISRGFARRADSPGSGTWAE